MQHNRKSTEAAQHNMVARETDLKALPFPALAGTASPTDLPWWKRFLIKAGTLEMTQQQQAPRLNSTVLALCSLILVFVGLIAGGSVQYGRLINQVDTLQGDVKTLKDKQADDELLKQKVQDQAADIRLLKVALKLQ